MPVEFGEPFWGYAIQADGFHRGRSLPITDETRMMSYIAAQIDKCVEIRFTDANDNLVMHVVHRHLVWPKAPASTPAGTVLIWKPEIKHFRPKPLDAIRPGSYEAFSTCIKNGYGMKVICRDCEKLFSPENVKTTSGWRETQISGMCEVCFDKLFEDSEDPEEDPVDSLDRNDANQQGM